MAKAKVQATDDPTQDLMNKKFGTGTVMTLGDASHMRVTEGVSTGSPNLDDALGGMGLPLGRIIEVIGPESCSKTSLTITAMSNAQKAGMTCVIIDAEHSLDPVWCENLGLDLSNVKICQPGCGEEGIEVAAAYLASGKPCFIFIDSVAALVPKKELEGEIGDTHVGLQARMMSQSLRMLSGKISETKSIVVFSNQIRNKIGGYGNPEVTSGGLALKFYASCRIDLRRVEVLKEGDQPIGIRVKAKVLKNKVAQPFKEVTYCLFTDGGISKEGDVFDLCIKKGVLVKAGSWIKTAKGESFAQGENNAINLLKEDPSLCEELLLQAKAAEDGAADPAGSEGSVPSSDD